MDTNPLDSRSMYTMAINPLTRQMDMVPDLGWLYRNIANIAEQAATMNVVTFTHSEDISLTNNTIYKCTRPVSIISFPNWNWSSDMFALIILQSGDEAPSITLPPMFRVTGSAEANSIIEISLLDHAAIVTSVPID